MTPAPLDLFAFSAAMTVAGVFATSTLFVFAGLVHKWPSLFHVMSKAVGGAATFTFTASVLFVAIAVYQRIAP